jgi:hypothetical protein
VWVAVAAVGTGVVAGGIAAAIGGGATGSRPATHADVAGATLGGPAGPEGVALEEGVPLAPVGAAAAGPPVDGIECSPSEQVAYHVHTHLTVYANGALRPIPPGIGIVSPVAEQTAAGPFYGATRCYYWLHVHAQDGVIHIESPTTRTYTLGQFFDLWGQPLSSTQVGPLSGPLTVFVDGRPYAGDPAAIPLGSHEDVQIDLGTPTVPPQRVDWSGSGL